MPDALIKEVDSILSQDWGSAFTFDREAVASKGVVVILYAQTRRPIPLKMSISAKAFNNREFGHRELQRKIKECHPDSILEMRVSEINSVYRNAARRALREVEKDFTNWIKETADDLERMLGEATAQKFLEDVPLPSHIASRSSIQALQFFIESRIEFLRDL